MQGCSRPKVALVCPRAAAGARLRLHAPGAAAFTPRPAAPPATTRRAPGISDAFTALMNRFGARHCDR